MTTDFFCLQMLLKVGHALKRRSSVLGLHSIDPMLSIDEQKMSYSKGPKTSIAHWPKKQAIFFAIKSAIAYLNKKYKEDV